MKSMLINLISINKKLKNIYELKSLSTFIMV
ncbi:hypothetical protein Igag_0126 [Ignisphaera aggregans DSM 17230]|uniref:Uncharacterized protein n=1 Tax=Ignisphaera aggregans (strain DSM 17230 / JCM 13409 / AQ1.S1) TaxID=583356 RepID=E0SPV5_IGNAA|nr:hypothetical protein Igag_0126 [Ignisphaera aggregans DSM 17230]